MQSTQDYREFLSNQLERDAVKRLWLRIFIVLALLGGIVFLVVVVPRRFHMILAAIPFALVGVYVLMRWPSLGFVLLIVAAVFRATRVPLMDFPVAFISAMVGLWILRILLFREEIKLVSSPVLLPLLCYGIVTIFSFAMGQLPWYPIDGAPLETQIGGLLIHLVSFLALFIVAQFVRDIRWLKWMAIAFLATAALFAFFNLTPGMGKYTRTVLDVKATGGSLFRVWMVALGVSIFLFQNKLAWHWRIAAGLVAAAGFYIGFFKTNYWTSGWMPPAVAIGVMLLLWKPRVALLLLPLGLVFFAGEFEDLYNSVALGDNAYSTMTRLEAWKIVIEVAKVNPLLGLGPTNYRFYTVLFPILGFFVEFNSHNNYVDVFAQTGILGLICLTWFFIVLSQYNWRLLNHVPKGGFAYAFAMASLASIPASAVAAFLGDWLIPFYYNIGIDGMRGSMLSWLFWGGLIAITQIMKQGKPVD